MHSLIRRATGLLILVVLVLPYVRAPLCQAGSHEHDDHHSAANASAILHAPSHGSDAAADCHTLMGCAVVLQSSLPVVAPGFRAFTDTTGDALPLAAAPIESRASPDTPPPKTV